jgi:signal transduction histidine kinase
MEYQKIFPVFVTNKSLLQKQADEKNIEIKINSDENVMAYFDKDMLCIVIRNLLSNAIKFTHNGGIITMSAYIDNNKVFVEIADTGIGFDKENLAKINDSSTYFTSLGTNAEKGTGLGLKICKELVEKNRGMLLMRKNSPKGTVIYFNLLAPKE